MAKLVYIKKYAPNTLLHWSESTRNNYVKLRDFSLSRTSPPNVIERDLAEAEAELQKDGNFTIPGQLPTTKIDDIPAWHDFVCQKNKERNLTKPLSERLKNHWLIVTIVVAGSLAAAITSIVKLIQSFY